MNRFKLGDIVQGFKRPRSLIVEIAPYRITAITIDSCKTFTIHPNSLFADQAAILINTNAKTLEELEELYPELFI